MLLLVRIFLYQKKETPRIEVPPCALLFTFMYQIRLLSLFLLDDDYYYNGSNGNSGYSADDDADKCA